MTPPTAGDHIWRAIVESPYDAYPRQAYQDWLAENHVGDDDRLDRAEFIRLSTLLEATPKKIVLGTPLDPTKAGQVTNPEWVDLRRKAWEILVRHFNNWAIEPFAGVWADLPPSRKPKAYFDVSPAGKLSFDVTITWPPPPCTDDDERYPDVHTHRRIGVEFELGLPSRVACPMDIWLTYGPTIVTQAPIRNVNLTDATPSLTRRQGGGGPHSRTYVWFREDAHRDSGDWRPETSRSHLPVELMPDPERRRNNYRELTQAMEASSYAALRYARRKAGLPDLE